MAGPRLHPLLRERAFLEAEARLAPDVAPGPASRDRSGVTETVLLTGATGFIGAHLLSLLSAESRVVCLVRAGSPAEGLTRLRSAAARWSLPDATAGRRVIALPGELGRPRFGLDAPAWERLAAEVDTIVHFGASGAWMAPYERVADVDVGGVREVLRLATTTRLKPVHYAGSLASWASVAVPAGARIDEATRFDAPETLLGGYCQGKWVAEALLAEATRRGIPVAIYRLGDVKGHSRTGLGNADDFGHRLVRACLSRGVAPDLPDYRVHYLPVDEVVVTVTALVADPRAPGHVFQLANPEIATWSELLAVARARGHRLAIVPRDAWADGVRADPIHRDLSPVFRRLRLGDGAPETSLLDAGIRLYTHTHATDNTTRLLGHSGVRTGRPLSEGYLDRMIAWIEADAVGASAD